MTVSRSMADPICKVGDRTDFIFFDSHRRGNVNLTGEVIAVHPGLHFAGILCEHQYTIKSGNDRYRVAESNVSTPFGPWDD